MQGKVLLSVEEASAATGLDQKTVRAAVARGDIPGRRIGRLIKIPVWWVEEQRVGPRAQPAV
jgi:excisionase family DNA binding protein